MKPKNTTPDPEIVERIEFAMLKARAWNNIMREHEQGLVDAAKERRKYLRDLRELKVPYRIIAEHLNVTEQAIYKDLRWGK